MHASALAKVNLGPGCNKVISCGHGFCGHPDGGPGKALKGVDRRPASMQEAGDRKRKVCRALSASGKTMAVATETASMVATDRNRTPKVSITAVIPAHKRHPLGASWHEVMSHVADRLTWEDPDFKVQIFTEEALVVDGSHSKFSDAVQSAQIMLILDIQQPAKLDLLLGSMRIVPTAIALGSHPQLEAATSLDNITLTTPWEKAAAALPWSSSAKGSKVLQSVRQVYKRQTSDDLLFMLLVLIDAYITEVPLVKSMQAQDLSTIWKMGTKCGKQILACVRDPECKAALDCLTSCASNDQVCSFRCIVSYESQLLEDFSLCILQKNNCLGLSADIPIRPRVLPMTHFQGQPLTHHQAEDLFIGWLGKKKWSWRVVAGQNVAYDQFPCQYQLYYRGKAKNSLWYDPVFQVRLGTQSLHEIACNAKVLSAYGACSHGKLVACDVSIRHFNQTNRMLCSSVCQHEHMRCLP
ncbi:TPA: Vitamin D3 receptor [Trebouxia sp. C0005]